MRGSSCSAHAAIVGHLTWASGAKLTIIVLPGVRSSAPLLKPGGRALGPTSGADDLGDREQACRRPAPERADRCVQAHAVSGAH